MISVKGRWHLAREPGGVGGLLRTSKALETKSIPELNMPPKHVPLLSTLYYVSLL